MTETTTDQSTVSSGSNGSRPHSPGKGPRIALLIAVIIIVLIGDLWSKQWAWDTLRDGERVTVIEHVLYLKLGFNTGSAFSLLQNAEWSRGFFIAVTILALVYMAWLSTHMSPARRYGFIAIGLIAGGALGNLHDRFVRVMQMPFNGELVERHGVIDFIQFYYDWSGGRYWPIFNVADSALVCGVVLLLLHLRSEDKARLATAQTPAEDDKPAPADPKPEASPASGA